MYMCVQILILQLSKLKQIHPWITGLSMQMCQLRDISAAFKAGSLTVERARCSDGSTLVLSDV